MGAAAGAVKSPDRCEWTAWYERQRESATSLMGLPAGPAVVSEEVVDEVVDENVPFASRASTGLQPGSQLYAQLGMLPSMYSRYMPYIR